MVELELQCNSALKESAPKWQEDAISSYYKTHHDAAIKTPLLTIQLWIQLHTYIHIQGSSLSISSHKSVILQVQSRPLSAMHGGLTQPCLMCILYNYVRPGSLRGPGVFFDRQDLLSVRWPCTGTWVYGVRRRVQWAVLRISLCIGNTWVSI